MASDALKKIASSALAPAWGIVNLLNRSKAPSDAQNPLAVMVHSFDGYKQFWPAARHFTERAIPQSVPIYYVSERAQMHPDPARCILTGEGGFTTRLSKGLGELAGKHKYVLYLQEDIWIDEPISEARLATFVDEMDRHRIDCLKLGVSAFADKDRDSIWGSTDPLPGADNLRWFGPHNYSMGHHCTIFRTNYFWHTNILARIFRVEHPHKNERFISEALKGRIKARNADHKKIRVAIWDKEPLVTYAHGYFRGSMTAEGQDILERHGISLDEKASNEVFREWRPKS